jgi:hypothetical protein
MKKALLYSLFGIVCLISVDTLCGLVYRKLLKSLPDNETFLSYMYQNLYKKESDVLIIGASQVKYGYDTDIFCNIMEKSCYNAGWAGYGLLYYQVIIDATIKRHKPELILIDINEPYLSGMYRFQNTKMKCWYDISPSVQDCLDQNTTFIEHLKLKSNLYKYNRITQQLIRTYNLTIQHPNGYEPLYGVLKQAEPNTTEAFKLDSAELRLFENIVSISQKNDITLIVSQAPSFSYDTKFNEWWEEYLKQHNIIFFNYSTDTFFMRRPNLFSDKWHLNHEGAKIYSERLALKCRDILSAKHESRNQ